MGGDNGLDLVLDPNIFLVVAPKSAIGLDLRFRDRCVDIEVGAAENPSRSSVGLHGLQDTECRQGEAKLT